MPALERPSEHREDESPSARRKQLDFPALNGPIIEDGIQRPRAVAGKVDDGLVRRMAIPGKEEVDGDTFLPVSIVEGNLLGSRAFRPVRDGLDPGGQVGLRVVIKPAINRENFIGAGLSHHISCRGHQLERLERLGQPAEAGDLLHATETEILGPHGRGKAVEMIEQVLGFVPSASAEEPFSPAIVPAPLLDVAGHVVGPIRAHALEFADRRRALSSEIAGLDDVTAVLVVIPGGPFPVIDRWQCLAREFRVGRGLIPAHACNGMIGGSFRIGAQPPGRRSEPTGSVHELLDPLRPGKRPPVLEDSVLPVLLVFVAPGVDEFLELRIRDLVPVEEEVY